MARDDHALGDAGILERLTFSDGNEWRTLNYPSSAWDWGDGLIDHVGLFFDKRIWKGETGRSAGSFAGTYYLAELPDHTLTMVGNDDGKNWWAIPGLCRGRDMEQIIFHKDFAKPQYKLKVEDIMAIDKDKDGEVTLAEATQKSPLGVARATALFNAIDVNRDGTIDGAEAQAYQERCAPARPPRLVASALGKLFFRSLGRPSL